MNTERAMNGASLRDFGHVLSPGCHSRQRRYRFRGGTPGRPRNPMIPRCLVRTICAAAVLFALHLWAIPAAGQSAQPASGTLMVDLTDLSLIDAARMAISQQPDVFIAAENANYRKGVYTQAGGGIRSDCHGFLRNLTRPGEQRFAVPRWMDYGTTGRG